MKMPQSFLLLALMLLTFSSPARTTLAASIEDIAASARKEGALDFYGPLTIGPEGSRQLGAAFNKKYGLNLNVKFAPSANMDRDLSRVITEAATGKEPEYDVMLVPDT